MVSNVLTVLDKVGNFLNKYQDSQYGYSEPSGQIDPRYQEIGEVLGIPVYIDTGTGYTNEFLDFPSLGDILNTIANTGISFDTKITECTACLTISYTIPLISYPPITICLANPKCEEEEEEDTRDCIPREEWEELVRNGETNSSRFKPICPEPDPELPFDPDSPPPCEVGYSFRYSYRYNGELFWTPWYYRLQGEYLFGWTNYPAPFAEEGNYFDIVEGSNISIPGSNCVYGISTTGSTFNKYGWQSHLYYAVCILSNGEVRTAGGIDSYEGVISFEFDNVKSSSPPKLIPPPIPDPVIFMNDCCDEVLALLKKMKKQLEELYKVVNPVQFLKGDCTVPSNFIYPTNDSYPVKLTDLPDYLGAIVRTVDRKLGSLPQLIHIKDSDPTIEGDQPVDLVINSVADMLKLTLEYLIQVQGETGAAQAIAGSTLFEAGATHQITVSIHALCIAIAEYLDFEMKDVLDKFPMAFDPRERPKPEDDPFKYLTRLLKPHEQQIDLQEWAGGESLKDKINDIGKKASIAAAALSSTKDINKLIEETMQIERLKRLLQVKETNERLGITDLTAFFNESEKGYPDSKRSPQAVNKPYGFDPNDKRSFTVSTKGSKKTKYKQRRPQPNQGQ